MNFTFGRNVCFYLKDSQSGLNQVTVAYSEASSLHPKIKELRIMSKCKFTFKHVGRVLCDKFCANTWS